MKKYGLVFTTLLALVLPALAAGPVEVMDNGQRATMFWDETAAGTYDLTVLYDNGQVVEVTGAKAGSYKAILHMPSADIKAETGEDLQVAYITNVLDRQSARVIVPTEIEQGYDAVVWYSSDDPLFEPNPLDSSGNCSLFECASGALDACVASGGLVDKLDYENGKKCHCSCSNGGGGDVICKNVHDSNHDGLENEQNNNGNQGSSQEG